MRETRPDQTSVLLSRDELVRMRAKAVRRGVWFRVLTRSERAQVDLTVKLVRKVRSFLLGRVLSSLAKKLREAMESKVTRFMRTVGTPLAEKLSQLAQQWGNPSAIRWAKDPGFVQYLAVVNVNMPEILKPI